MKKAKYLRKNGRSRFSKEYSLQGKLHPEAVTHCVRTASGITLVALVVTIIILLILAGVTLALISGGNGILNKAEVAVDKTKEAAAREKLEMELINVKADVLSKGEKVSLTNLDERKEELAGNGVTIAESGTPRDVSFDGYTFKVNDDLIIEGDGINTGNSNSGDSSNGGETTTPPSGDSVDTSALEARISALEESISKIQTNTPTIFNGTVVTNTMGASNTNTLVNRFTVTENGKYVINYEGNLYWNASTAFNVRIFKNGNELVGHTYSNGPLFTGGWLNATEIAELKKDDVIDIYLYQYGNGSAGEHNLAANKLELIKVGN